MNMRAATSVSALVLVTAGLAGGGCAEVGSTMRTGEPAKESKAAAAPYDLQALDTLAEHHREGIEISKLADDKAEMPEVRSMATNVERDDAEELTRLQAYRTMWFGARQRAENPNLPGAEGLTPQEMSQLKNLVGEDFDRMFIDKMIEHHRSGIALVNDIKKNTQREELQEMADEMLREQENELELLEQFRSEVRGQGE